MKDDAGRPLYRDLSKQKWYSYLGGEPVRSEEKTYECADRPLLAVVFLATFAACFFIGIYIPGVWNNSLIKFIASAAIMFHPMLYHWFVYKFGRFRPVTQSYFELNDEEDDKQDESSNLLKAEESRRAAQKSRFAFVALLLAAAAAAIIFYIFSWGTAEQRVKNSEQIQELKRIAEKQGDVSFRISEFELDGSPVFVWLNGNEAIEMEQQDAEELRRIYRELQWYYVDDIEWEYGTAHIKLRGGFESKYFDVYFGQQ